MKQNLLIAIIGLSVLATSEPSLAYGYGYGYGYGHGYSCRYGYGCGGYGPGWTDADTAVFAGLSASMLSLSALDAAERSRRVVVIQHAETEALNYNSEKAPSAVFLNAKSTVEFLQGQKLNNQEAADLIVALNQKFREE